MKRKALCMALALCMLLSLPATAAAGEVSVAVQDGYASDWGVEIPFTRSGRTDSYTFALYPGEAVSGTPEVTAAVTVSTTSPVTVSLPLRYDVTGPSKWTLQVTANTDPRRAGLDRDSLLTRTFTVAKAPTCGCAAGTAGAYYVGSGTAASPYRVGSQAQLSHMRRHLSAHHKLESDLTLTGSWDSVGRQSTPFSGVFDGNGHSISGLQSTTGGLFYTVKGAGSAVRNLTLLSPKVSNSTTENGEVANTGAVLTLAGAVANVLQSGAEVSDCTVENAELRASATGSVFAIVGGISPWTEDSRVLRCRATGSLSGESSGHELYVGGITGESRNATFIDCETSVSITGSAKGSFLQGGISGSLWGHTVERGPIVMQNCRWTYPEHAVGIPTQNGGPFTPNTGESFGNRQVASID